MLSGGELPPDRSDHSEATRSLLPDDGGPADVPDGAVGVATLGLAHVDDRFGPYLARFAVAAIGTARFMMIIDTPACMLDVLAQKSAAESHAG